MSHLEFFICGGMALVGFYLLQLNSSLARKVGLLSFCISSSLGIYFLTRNYWLGVVTAIAWFLLPISELFLIVRKLRVPQFRTLISASAPREDIETLQKLTEDLVNLGFRQVDECRLDESESEQFYRLFINEKEPIHASISYVSDHQVGFHFVGFSSRDQANRLWVTWDYPLTYGLKVPPGIALFRNLYSDDAADLYASHLEFLKINGALDQLVMTDSSPQAVRARLQETLQTQLDYNIREGILATEKDSDHHFRYSWRGTIYVTAQVLRDLVKL